MLYNKRQVRKANDKKVLHKVGKQWQVVSLAVLMAIGGIGAATHLSAHADTTNNNNRANADSTNTIKERLNSSLQKTSAQGSQANQNVRQTQAASPKSITNQASVLHNRILQNATNNVNSNRQQANSPVQSQGRVNANATQQNSANGNNNQAATLRQRVNNSVQTKGVETPTQYRVGGINPSSYQQYFDNVPVTVAYVNSDGTVQTASDGQHPRIATKYITLAGNNNNPGSDYTGLTGDGTNFAVDHSDATDSIGNHYVDDQNALNGYKWNINGGTYHFDPSHQYAVKPSDLQSDSVANPNAHDSAKNPDTWATWDKTNNRPLIVMKSSTPSNQKDQINVNFYNETGQEISTTQLTGDYGDTINTQSDASDYNPDKTDYTVDNSNIKNNYTFSDTPQDVTIPLKGADTHKDSNKVNWNSDNGQANNFNKVEVDLVLNHHDGTSDSYKTDNNLKKTIYLNGQIGNFKDLDPHDLLGQTRNPHYDPREQIEVPNDDVYDAASNSIVNKTAGKPTDTKPVNDVHFLDTLNPNYNPQGYKHLNPNYNPQVGYRARQFSDKPEDDNEYLGTANPNYNPAIWVHNNSNYNPGDTTTHARWSQKNGGTVDNQEYTPAETEGANGYTLAKDMAQPSGSDKAELLHPGQKEDDNFFVINPAYNPATGAPKANQNYENSTPVMYQGKQVLDSSNIASAKPVKTTNKAFNPHIANFMGTIYYLSTNPADPLLNPAESYNNDQNTTPTVKSTLHGGPENDQKFLDGTNGTSRTTNSNYNPMIWQKSNPNYNPDVTLGGKPVNNQKYSIDSTENPDTSWNVAQTAPNKNDFKIPAKEAQWDQDTDVTMPQSYTRVSNNFKTKNQNYNPMVTKYKASNPNLNHGKIDNNQYIFVLNQISPNDTQTLLNPNKPKDPNKHVKNPDYNPGHMVTNPHKDMTEYIKNNSPFAMSDLDNYVVDPSNEDNQRFYLKGTSNADKSNTPQAVTYSVGNNGQVGSEDHKIQLTFDEAPDYGHSQPITLTYKNQDNTVVGTDTITPTSDAYGSTIDMTDPNSYVKGYQTVNENGQTTSNEAQWSANKSDFEGATGMKVPDGYTIDPNQTTKFTINSDDQHPTVYVTGNGLQTNNGTDPHTFTVNVHEYLYNSDGKAASVATKSDKDNGWNSDKISPNKTVVTKTITLHPQIFNQIGNTKTLYASMFQPSRGYHNNALDNADGGNGIDNQKLQISSSDYSNPDGNNDSYQMKFAPGDITDMNGYVIGTTNNGAAHNAKAFNTSDGNIDFDYDIYPQQATYTTNHIYYISASDMNAFSHNVDDIDHDPSKANFITEKSDRGIPGKTSFNDSAYRENVPLGYQFDRVLGTSSNGKWNGVATANENGNGSKGVNGLNGFANNDQSEFIEVMPNAKPIHFEYVDQNGKDIKDYSDSPTMSQYIQDDGEHGYNSKWGQPVLTKDIEQNVPDHDYVLGIPDGYNVDPHNLPDQDPKFSRYVQHIKIQVVGNKVSPKDPSTNEKFMATVHIHEEDPEGNTVTKSYSDPDYVDGRIGDSFSINASDYIPNGYSLDTNKGKDKSVQGTIQQTGVDPNTANFYYKPIADHNANDLKPVNVVFKDGTSQVSYQSLNPNSSDYSGESVPVNKLSGYTVPSGYSLVPNQNYNAIMSTTSDPTVNLQVYNPQASDAGIIQITQKRYHNYDTKSGETILHNTQSDGTTTSDVVVHGKQGTSEQLNANDHQLAGYSDQGSLYIHSNVSPSDFTDNNQTVQFGKNGQVTLTHTNQANTADGVNNITWDYLAQTSNNHGSKPANSDQPGPVGPKTNEAQPIYVQYYDGTGTSTPLKSDGSKGSDNIRVNGYMNQDFSDITQANSDTKKIFQNNWHLIGVPQLNYSIGDQEQQVDLHVAPSKATDATEQVNLQLQDPSGNNIGGPISAHGVTLSDGQVATIQASDFMHGNPDYITEGVSFDGGNTYQKDYTVKDDPAKNAANPGKAGQIVAYNTANGKETSAANPVTFVYRAKSSNSDTNISPLIVNFYNKDGQHVGNQYKISSYNGNPLYKNEKIDILKGTSGVSDTQLNSDTGLGAASMPNGYSHLVKGQNDQYTVGNHVQYINLIVQGDPADYTFPVHSIEINQGAVPSNPTNKSDNGPFNYGSDFNVNASNYKVNPSDNIVNGTPTSDEVSVNPVNGHVFNPSDATFYYDKQPTDNNAGPLMVKYVDQSGDTVETTGIVNGTGKNNQTISNVTSDSKDGLAVPSNYTVNPNQHLSYKFTQGNGSTTQSLFGDTQVDKYGFGVMTINVTGKKDPAKQPLKITQILVNNNGTQKSDSFTDNLSGNYGDTKTIDASDYNVPGYHVSSNDTPAKIHFNNNGSISPNTASFYYDQNQTNQAGNITLTYINQNGQMVNPQGYIDHNLKNDQHVMNGTGMFGQKINVTDGSDTVAGIDGSAIGENVPNGYHVDPGQQTKYVFGYNNQNVVVMVHGDPVNPSDDGVNTDQLLINLHKYASDGTTSKGETSLRRYIDDQQITNSGDKQGLSVGDTISLAPSQFTPQGSDGEPYAPMKGSTPQEVTIGPSNDNSNHFQILTPQNKTVDFNYQEIRNASAPLNLTYLNQSGQQVGYTDPIIGAKGETVNVTDPSQGGESIPKGYQLDPNEYKHEKYQLSGTGHNIYLHVVGDKVASPKMTITVITKNSDGTLSVSDKTKNLSDLIRSDEARVQQKSVTAIPQPTIHDGDVYNISASDYNPDSSIYQEDYSKDSTKTVTVGASTFDGNGNPTNSYVSPNQVIFYYDTKQNDQDAAPITLRYINQKGQQEGTTDYIHGKLGKTVNLSDVSEGGESVPNGYHMNPSVKSQTSAIAFTNSPQIWNVPVIGNNANSNVFTLHQIVEDSDGDPIAGKARNVKITLGGAKVGDTITFNPYGFGLNSDITSINGGNTYSAPRGAHAVNSDADFSVTVQSDGTLSPVSTTDYRYEVSHAPKPIDTINVHYVTSDQSANVRGAKVDNVNGKNYFELDTETDRGQQSDALNLSPYRNDIPEKVGNNYISSGQIVAKDGTPISNDQLNKFGQSVGSSVTFGGQNNNTADVYVVVNPTAAGENSSNGQSNGPVWIG